MARWNLTFTAMTPRSCMRILIVPGSFEMSTEVNANSEHTSSIHHRGSRRARIGYPQRIRANVQQRTHSGEEDSP